MTLGARSWFIPAMNLRDPLSHIAVTVLCAAITGYAVQRVADDKSSRKYRQLEERCGEVADKAKAIAADCADCRRWKNAKLAESADEVRRVIESRALDIERLTGQRVLDSTGSIIDLPDAVCLVQGITFRKFGSNRQAARRALISDFGLKTGSTVFNADCLKF